MHRFTNILVAVDVAWDKVDAVELTPPSVEAVRRAMWLAEKNSAQVTIIHALDIPDTARKFLNDDDFGESTAQSATETLKRLMAQPASTGLVKNIEVRVGKSWLEVTRQVLRGEHDLVVAGTRNLGPLRGFFMGSTGMKLLRKCPCPVWITKPQAHTQIRSILVAHCLRTVGDKAMALGCSMAQLHESQLHVVHSLEFPELDSAFPARVPAEKVARFETEAMQHIQAQLADDKFTSPPQIHIVKETPHFAVLNQIKEHDIELLVMGTIARTAIHGFITGNTAERLLPQLPCSVLAVKPAGFVSPVSIDGN